MMIGEKPAMDGVLISKECQERLTYFDSVALSSFLASIGLPRSTELSFVLPQLLQFSTNRLPSNPFRLRWNPYHVAWRSLRTGNAPGFCTSVFSPIAAAFQHFIRFN